MPRLISFALTAAQFLDGSKTVTRRLGWQNAVVGMELAVVQKAMGLKKGEHPKHLGLIRVVDPRRERLDCMLADRTYGYRECVREGFPDMSPEQFVDFFCDTHPGCFPDRVITRIEFVKL